MKSFKKKNEVFPFHQCLPNSLISGLLSLFFLEVQYNSSISLWYGAT